MIEAMKQALEALESCGEDEWHTEDDFGMLQIYDEKKVLKAITAIRQAIEQAEKQEPVLCEFIRHTKEGTHWCALASQPADWVGLTSQDVHECFNLTEFDHHVDFNRDPEQWCLVFAKELSDTLKQKNGYEEKNT